MTRSIVVTGAASGIGKAVAALLAERGDRVIGVDLADSDIAADLGNAEGRSAAVAEIRAACDGVLDGVVTCAGIARPGVAMVSINYFGTTSLVAALQPELAASAAGRVVLIGSISGTHPADEALINALLDGDEPTAIARTREIEAAGESPRIYPSTKSGIAQWARRTSLAPGFADAGVPVNVVAPGVVLTPMTKPLFDDPTMRKIMDDTVPSPLGYVLPEDIAEVVAFLVSTANSKMTGQVVYVDSGAEVSTRPNSHF